jgi:hypothetical protein
MERQVYDAKLSTSYTKYKEPAETYKTRFAALLLVNIDATPKQPAIATKPKLSHALSS